MAAGAEANLKATITAQDKTGGIFKQVGDKMKGLEAGSGSLSNSLTKLAGAGAALYAGWKAFDFLKSSIDAAAESEKVFAQLNAVLESTGHSAGVTAEQMRELSKTLEHQSTFSDEAVLSATNLLLTFTNIKSELIGGATQAVLDMSTALGQDTKDSAIQLGKALQDPIVGVTALRRVGVAFTEDQVKLIKSLVETGKGAQAQAMIMKEVNKEFGGSAAAALNTYGGQVALLKNQFDDLKEEVGRALMPTMSAFFQGMIDGMNASEEKTQDLSTAIGERLLQRLLQVAAVGKGVFQGLVGGDSLKDIWGNIKENLKEVDDGIEADMKAKLTSKSTGILPKVQADFGATGDAAKKMAEKIASAFKDLSSKVVSAVNDQEDAIAGLRKNIQDLDTQLNDDLAKANDKFKGDATELARRAKQRMDDIDKQIADEQASQGQGFRTKIEQLQKEKAKEQAIIDKAGGVVSDLTAQLQEDDFDQLKQAHEKELKEIKDQAERKKLEAQREMLERQKFLLETALQVKSPGFFSSATKQGMSFLGDIGASALQQSLSFNFNQVVAGDAGIQAIIKMVVAELNRQATLHSIGGK